MANYKLMLLILIMFIIDLSKAFNNYEVLDKNNFHMETRVDVLILKIKSFGLEFELNLRENSEFIGEQMTKEHGSLIYIEGSVKASNGHSGMAFGEYEEDSYKFEGQFEVDKETYFVEDFKDHLVIYRGSDQKVDKRQNMSQPVTVKISSENVPIQQQLFQPRSGQLMGHVCPMQIIVDKSLYQELKGHYSAIMKMVTRLLRTANMIFQDNLITVHDVSKPVMFRLDNLLIADEQTCASREFRSHVICRSYFSPDKPYEFLRRHALKNHDPYCLSYVFTKHDFLTTLGVAYVEGICSRFANVIIDDYGNVEKRSANTGWIRVADPINGLLQAELTFAHEMGHSFGSDHDDGIRCPEDYLMSPFAPTVLTSTSLKFSICSRRNISLALSEIKNGYDFNCFVEPNKLMDNKVINFKEVTPNWPNIHQTNNDENGSNKVAVKVTVPFGLVAVLVGSVISYLYRKRKMCFAGTNKRFDKVPTKERYRPKTSVAAISKNFQPNEPEQRKNFANNVFMKMHHFHGPKTNHSQVDNLPKLHKNSMVTKKLQQTRKIQHPIPTIQKVKSNTSPHPVSKLTQIGPTLQPSPKLHQSPKLHPITKLTQIGPNLQPSPKLHQSLKLHPITKLTQIGPNLQPSPKLHPSPKLQPMTKLTQIGPILQPSPKLHPSPKLQPSPKPHQNPKLQPSPKINKIPKVHPTSRFPQQTATLLSSSPKIPKLEHQSKNLQQKRTPHFQRPTLNKTTPEFPRHINNTCQFTGLEVSVSARKELFEN